MYKEINSGYAITDRLIIGNTEFVIGQNENAPAKFVTWRSEKGKSNYYWGNYCTDRLTALENLCKRALDEIHYLKDYNQEKNNKENPVKSVKQIKKEYEPPR